MAKRILIVYYTFTGNTGGLARSLTATLGEANLDVEQIREPRPRRGFGGGLRAGFAAMLRRVSPILPPLRRPAEYDAVLLGTPIWMGRVATPVREYLRTQSFGRARLGLFSTSGGPVGLATLREVERLAGRPVASRLHLITREAPDLERIRTFLEPLGLALGPPTLAGQPGASAPKHPTKENSHDRQTAA